jgi:hypothetical protein
MGGGFNDRSDVAPPRVSGSRPLEEPRSPTIAKSDAPKMRLFCGKTNASGANAAFAGRINPASERPAATRLRRFQVPAAMREDRAARMHTMPVRSKHVRWFAARRT